MKTLQKIKDNNFKIIIKYEKSMPNPRKKSTNLFKLAFLNNNMNLGDSIVSLKTMNSIINKKNISFFYVFIRKDKSFTYLTTPNNNKHLYPQLIGIAYLTDNSNSDYSVIAQLLNNELYDYQQFINNISYSIQITSKKYNFNKIITGNSNINNLFNLYKNAFIAIQEFLDDNNIRNVIQF